MKKPKDFEKIKFHKDYAYEVNASLQSDDWGSHIVIRDSNFGLKMAKEFHTWLTKTIAFMEALEKQSKD